MRNKFFLQFKQYSALILLAIFVIFNAIFTSNFLALGNLNNMITQLAPTLICAMGMTLVISTGGIDISVGSVMALSAVCMAKFMPTIGILPAILLAVLASSVVGLVHGFFIGKLKLQAMVITLGTMLLVRGLAQVLSSGRDIYFNKLGESGASLSAFGTKKIFGIIPIQIIPVSLVIFIVWLIVEKMLLGRQIQAVGDNRNSSYLVGIEPAKVMSFVYVLCSILAALAGILQAAKVQVAAGSSLGQLAELDAIAAVVIGGTPMSGGKAKVFGTIIGALIMQMITLSCVMNNIHQAYAQVFKAIIIVIAIWIQKERKA